MECHSEEAKIRAKGAMGGNEDRGWRIEDGGHKMQKLKPDRHGPVKTSVTHLVQNMGNTFLVTGYTVPPRLCHGVT